MQRYNEQLLEKIRVVNELFSDVALPDIEVFQGPPEHYRLR